MITLVDGLNPAGRKLVSARLKDPSLRIAGSEPLRDIVSDGGWAAQSGMDLWGLAGVALLLFRTIFVDAASMVRPFLLLLCFCFPED